MTIPTDGRIDLDALAELARKATPGPWKVYDGSSWRRIGTVGARYDDGAVLQPYVASDGHPDMCAGRGQDTYANLNYIAALDPQTVLALIDLARRAAIPSERGPVEVDGEPIMALYDGSDPVMANLEHLSRDGYATDSQRATARAAHAEILRLRSTHPAPAAGVKVKALEWRELTSPREDGPAEPNGEWEALCVFGAYSIDFDTDDDVAKYPFCVWTPEDSLGHFASADDAKAAAQADYEARILSALDQGEEVKPSREWFRDKIASDPDLETEVRPAGAYLDQGEPK